MFASSNPPHRRFFFFLVSCLVVAIIGILWRAHQTTNELTSNIALLRPGGNAVSLPQDRNDFSISPVRAGPLVYPVAFDGDVRDLPQIYPSKQAPHVEFEPGETTLPIPNFADPVRQGALGPNTMPTPDISFPGLDMLTWGNGHPPDTHGDVGPAHYIQAVNTSIGIFSKTGTLLAGFTFDAFFDGTGTPCDISNIGDPIVLYDNVSGRWIISDLAWTNLINGPYYACLAVSQSDDPVAGGWYLYALRADDDEHPWANDYLKMAAWQDGIYMTANMYDCLIITCGNYTYEGIRIWALNRTDLITGSPLNNQLADLGSAYFCLLPANAKLNTPAAGMPEYFMTLQTTTEAYTWKWFVDWISPENSVLSGPMSTTLAEYSNAASVPQRSSNILLASLSGRFMVQLQYTEVNGTPALWGQHSVTSNSVAGIRWYEFRGLNDTPTVFQQGTFQPDDLHRWMGSLAIDSQGNMAVGYSASNAAVDPQIRYAGRFAEDPLNTLGQGEATLITGSGAQTTVNRWGDYSSMTIDIDGCTFWYTSEYYLETGMNWQTRIGAFAFPSCAGIFTPTPTSTDTPTPSPTQPPDTPTPTPPLTNTPTYTPTATPTPPPATEYSVYLPVLIEE